MPLLDGGTIHLSGLIGFSSVMHMILIDRPVRAEKALAFGFAN